MTGVGWLLAILGAAEVVPLENGVELVLDRHDGPPIASVAVGYRAGRIDEPPGRYGLAHLAEHVTFRFAPVEDGIEKLESIGGQWNGATYVDATLYHETVPTAWIGFALWLERERMRLAHESLDPDHVAIEKKIVAQELLERSGTSEEMSREAQRHLVAESHPLYEQTSELEEVERHSAAEVSWFLRTHYRPNNVVIVVSGMFERESVLEQAKRYWGGIPSEASVRPSPRNLAPSVPRRVRVNGRTWAAVDECQVVWAVESVRAAPLRVIASALHAQLEEGGAESQTRSFRVVPNPSRGIAFLNLRFEPVVNGPDCEQLAELGQKSLTATSLDTESLATLVREELTDRALRAYDSEERAIALALRRVRGHALDQTAALRGGSLGDANAVLTRLKQTPPVEVFLQYREGARKTRFEVSYP